MKTKYKYIYFDRWSPSNWRCRNNKTDDILGSIVWDQQWKEYVFQAKETAIFSASCLYDIFHFMNEIKGIDRP